MHNVIFTLTTVPTRLNDPSDTSGIRPGLKTILEQTGTYEVHLNIPYAHRLQSVEIPTWLGEWQEQYPNLKIFRCPDFGPITKIYPTLERVTDPNAIIITVDDDLLYHDGIVAAHLDAIEKYPGCVIGYAGITEINESSPMDTRGVHATGEFYFCTSQTRDARVRIIEGYKTVSYRRSYFEEDFNNFAFMHWNDDIIISAYMGYKNIKKIILACPDCEGDYSPRVESFPVIGHVPLQGEPHGCRVFRMDEELLKYLENTSNYWYHVGYLER